MDNVKKTLRELEALDEKKRRSLKVKFAGIFLTALFFTIVSIPIIGIGVFVGWLIWS